MLLERIHDTAQVATEANIECDTCNIAKGKNQTSTHEMQQTTTVGDILILRIDRISGGNDRKDNSHVPFEKSYWEHGMQLAFGVAGVETSSQDGTPPTNMYRLKSAIEHGALTKRPLRNRMRKQQGRRRMDGVLRGQTLRSLVERDHQDKGNHAHLRETSSRQDGDGQDWTEFWP